MVYLPSNVMGISVATKGLFFFFFWKQEEYKVQQDFV